MAETPKTREELLNELFQRHATLSYRGAVSVIETIESLGLRIVPVDPTGEMHEAAEAMSAPTNEEIEDLLTEASGTVAALMLRDEGEFGEIIVKMGNALLALAADREEWQQATGSDVPRVSASHKQEG